MAPYKSVLSTVASLERSIEKKLAAGKALNAAEAAHLAAKKGATAVQDGLPDASTPATKPAASLSETLTESAPSDGVKPLALGNPETKKGLFGQAMDWMGANKLATLGIGGAALGAGTIAANSGSTSLAAKPNQPPVTSTPGTPPAAPAADGKGLASVVTSSTETKPPAPTGIPDVAQVRMETVPEVTKKFSTEFNKADEAFKTASGKIRSDLAPEFSKIEAEFQSARDELKAALAQSRDDTQKRQLMVSFGEIGEKLGNALATIGAASQGQKAGVDGVSGMKESKANWQAQYDNILAGAKAQREELSADTELRNAALGRKQKALETQQSDQLKGAEDARNASIRGSEFEIKAQQDSRESALGRNARAGEFNVGQTNARANTELTADRDDKRDERKTARESTKVGQSLVDDRAKGKQANAVALEKQASSLTTAKGDEKDKVVQGAMNALLDAGATPEELQITGFWNKGDPDVAKISAFLLKKAGELRKESDQLLAGGSAPAAPTQPSVPGKTIKRSVIAARVGNDPAALKAAEAQAQAQGYTVTD